VKNLKGKEHLRDIAVNGKIILKYIKHGISRCGLDLSRSGYRLMRVIAKKSTNLLISLEAAE
jgi:hypothetical protein